MERCTMPLVLHSLSAPADEWEACLLDGDVAVDGSGAAGGSDLYTVPRGS